MIWSMRTRWAIVSIAGCAASLVGLSLLTTQLAFAASGLADKKPQQDKTVKPMAGPRATMLRETPLYVAPDTTSQKVDRVQEGRELVVAEHSGPWVRVFANTDVEEVNENDAPVFGREAAPPPVSGWMQARGLVEESTPNGDRILLGEGASLEILAEDARGPRNAGQDRAASVPAAG